jgi:hypothetical protein
MNWDYIAGFFDGEGYVFVGNRLLLSISQVNLSVLQEIQKFSGLGNIIENNDRQNKRWNENWQDSYIYQITKTTEVAEFLEHIQEKVIVKKPKLEQALKQFEVIMDRRQKRLDDRLQLHYQIEQWRSEKLTWKEIGVLLGRNGDTIRKNQFWYKQNSVALK